MVNNLNAEALRNALVVASMEYCKKYLEGQKRWNDTIDLSCEDFFKMKQLVQNDTKLQAVKHVKESAKCGLKEAKNFVDTYRDYVLND